MEDARAASGCFGAFTRFDVGTIYCFEKQACSGSLRLFAPELVRHLEALRDAEHQPATIATISVGVLNQKHWARPPEVCAGGLQRRAHVADRMRRRGVDAKMEKDRSTWVRGGDGGAGGVAWAPGGYMPEDCGDGSGGMTPRRQKEGLACDVVVVNDSTS